MSDRNLTRMVTDTFRAPRWVHHLLKFVTGVIVLVLIYALLRAGLPLWVSAGILSFAWVLTTKVAARLERGSSVYEVGPDLACDLSLHLMPVAILLALWWSWVIGLAWFLLLAVLYYFTYPEASP